MNLGFAFLNPIPCFIYYILLIILVMSIPHPLFLIFALVSQVILNILQDGGKKLYKSIKYYLFLGLIVAILNPFVSHKGKTVLFYFFNSPFTLEALVYGLIMMLSLLTVLISFVSFNMVITPDKFMYLFSSIFPKTAFLSMMSMRFVPLLKRRSKDISLIQQTNGVDVFSGKFIDRIKDGMLILNILLTWSLEEAFTTAKSMRARGYGVRKKRSSYFGYEMHWYDLFYVLFFLVSGCFILYFWHKKFQHFSIYPKIFIPAFDQDTFILLFLSLSFLGVPIILEGNEVIRWRR